VAAKRAKQRTDWSEPVAKGHTLRLMPCTSAHWSNILVGALMLGLVGLVFGAAVGALIGAGLGVAFGVYINRTPHWTFDLVTDALVDGGRNRVGSVRAIEQIKVKGEYRAKEGRVVHYVALVGGALPEGQVKIGRWTPARVRPVVAALAGYLNVPVVEKGLPMSGDAAASGPADP